MVVDGDALCVQAFELGRRSNSGGTLDSPKATLAPAGESLIKRTGTLANLVSKVMNAASEPAHIRAREDAKVADQAYRGAVRNVDRQRLVLEDRIEDTLKTLQAWEAERLRAVKSGAHVLFIPLVLSVYADA